MTTEKNGVNISDSTATSTWNSTTIIENIAAVESLIFPVLYLGLAFVVTYLIYKVLLAYFIAKSATKTGVTPSRTLFNGNYPSMRMGTGGIVGMNEKAATQLTAKVTKAVEERPAGMNN